MKKVIKNIFFAISFLTVFPIPQKVIFRAEDTGKSTAFFPIVGFIIGLIGFAFSLLELFHPFTRAVIICVYFLLITRGIHADGLLDTFDGFFSMKYGKDKIKKIMKDPGVGAMGFVGGFAFFLLKIVALFEIIRSETYGHLIITLVPSISRGGISFICLLARKSLVRKSNNATSDIAEGLGKRFILSSGINQFVLSTFFIFLFAIVVFFVSKVAWVLLLPFLNIGFWSFWYILCKNRLGVINGDTMGAGIEIAEVFLYFAGFSLLYL